MPNYKGVYYADGAADMSVADISAIEASSINDVIGSIRGGGMVVPVASVEERDAIFPTPSDGNAVWREDIGVEQRYTTALGWIASSDGFMPIVPQSVVGSGTNNTFKIDPVSGVTFSSCVSLTLNNIFTKEFDNYKVIINVDSTTNFEAGFAVRYTTNGVNNSAANYVRAGIGADSATPNISYNATGGTALTAFGNNVTARNWTSEIDFMRPAYGYYPLSLSKLSSNNNSTVQLVSTVACQYNSGTTAFDGIYIYASAGVEKMTGNVKIYGYN